MIALLKHGADANARDPEESGSWIGTPPPRTLLHLCADLGCPPPVVQALLDAGADTDICDARGCTPLHYAIKQGRREIFTTHLHGADTSVQDLRGQTVLHRAAAAIPNRAIYVEDLISAGAAIHIKDKDGRTPLHLAAKNRRLNVMRALLRGGADAASVDKGGLTALHLAVTAERNKNKYGLRTYDTAVTADRYGLRTEDTAVTADRYGPRPDDIAKAVHLLLRWGADQEAVDASSERRTPARVWIETMVNISVMYTDRSAVQRLLAEARPDRAWRRRGWLMLCRTFPDRVPLRAEHTDAGTGVSRSVLPRRGAGSGNEIYPSTYAVEASSARTAPHKTRAVGGLSGLVARVVGLRDEGVFRTIMEFV